MRTTLSPDFFNWVAPAAPRKHLNVKGTPALFKTLNIKREVVPKLVLLKELEPTLHKVAFALSMFPK